MADIQCIGIKSTGDRCERNKVVGQSRCSLHTKTLLNNGPHTLARKELGFIHKREHRTLDNRYDPQFEVLDYYNRKEFQDLIEDRLLERQILRGQHSQARFALMREQRDEIIRTGIDPDEEANQRREQRHRIRHEVIIPHNIEEEEAYLHPNDQQHNRLERDEIIQEQLEILNQIQQQNVVGIVVDNQLANFARDNQNVHTKPAVIMVKQTVGKVLCIPVPEGYIWNTNECSKTPGDIITKCKLSMKAAWQMTAKYCQDEDIYDMGKGIYGKVLDCVWQFVLNSEHKEDLFKVIRQEMEDNIGMCAQGNLSRLCNVLSGYSEDIGSQESVSELLGRRLPLLMEIENINDRIHEAIRLMKDLKVDYQEWQLWIQPLVADEDHIESVDFDLNKETNEPDLIVRFKF